MVEVATALLNKARHTPRSNLIVKDLSNLPGLDRIILIIKCLFYLFISPTPCKVITTRDLFIIETLCQGYSFKFLLKSYGKRGWLEEDMTLAWFARRRIEGKKPKIYKSSNPSEKRTKRLEAENFDKSWKADN